MEYQTDRPDERHEFTELALVHELLKAGNHENVPSILDALPKQGQAQVCVRTCIEVVILMALSNRAEKNISTAVD